MNAEHSQRKPRESDPSAVSRSLQAKYRWTSLFYDLLDSPWERQYRKWRPKILEDLEGEVLELGVGTGRNLEYYPPDVQVTAVDLSQHMLAQAAKRASKASCSVSLLQGDATDLQQVNEASFDWVVSTFLFCVLPDSVQPLALAEIKRILRPGGRFRLLEMLYSEHPRLRLRQQFFAPFVERVYGARFDRNTRKHLEREAGLRVTSTRFLKADTYLLIEGKLSL